MKSTFLTLCIFFSLIACLLPASASAQTVTAWAVGVSYSVGALVTYDGVEYEALQAETSETGWEPSSTPALWEVVSSTCTTVPSAPTGLTASSTTSSGTTLSWTAPTTPTGCTLTYKVLQGGTSIATPSTTSDTVTGLTASTSYSFTVEATDAAGTSAASTAVSVTTSASSCTTVPSAPTGLTASGTTSSGTTLSWTAPTTPTGCTLAYKVLQGGTSIATPSATSDTVTGLTASTSYSFTVEDTDAAGTSAASTAVSVTTAAASSGGTCSTTWSATAIYTAGMTASLSGENYVANFWTQNQSPASYSGATGTGEPWTATGSCSACTTIPNVPTGLAASGTTSSGTTLNWTAPTTPTACTVSYKVLQGGTSIATPSTTSDTVTGLTASMTYSFAVEATDAAGTSAASTAVSVTTLASPCTAVPAAPTGLTASSTTSSGTTLSWTAPTTPTGCTLTYKVLRGGTSVATPTTTSDSVTGLIASTTYSFTVEAVNSVGTSVASSAVSVTTLASSTKFVGGWFEEWGTYYANSNVADLQTSGVASSLTHLIYAFAKPVANGSTVSCALSDSYADYQKVVAQVTGATAAASPLQGNFGAMVQLKQLHPNLKVLISIGGWNPPTYNELFDLAASTAAQREAFVSSCVSMFIQGNVASGVSTGTLFDGFDIDWEFPNANDTANYTALMTEFRNELTTLTATTGTTYQLVADLAAGPSTAGAAADSGNDGGYDTLDIAGLNAVLDYMNVDGYNYAGDWSNATNDASPLYDDTASPVYGTGITIDATVKYYLAHGATAAKYTMGFPLYGAGWAGGLTSTNSGMYQNATGITDPTGVLTTDGTSPVPNLNGVGNCSTGENQSSPAAGCDFLLTDGLATYRTLENLLNNGFTATYDSTRCVARMYNPTTATAFSYDNPQSVQCKVNYINTYGLGGGYVWALKDDDTSSTLTKALGTDLNP